MSYYTLTVWGSVYRLGDLTLRQAVARARAEIKARKTVVLLAEMVEGKSVRVPIVPESGPAYRWEEGS